MRVARALTIAGSDSGGGAGIQADLKTFQMLGVYGMTAITAITVQNTKGVFGSHLVPPELVAAQIDAVVRDIGTDAAKTGMLATAEIIEAVAAKIRELGITPLVVDPVMVAKGGAPLLEEDARSTLIRELFPLAAVVTPNISEAEALTGMTIRTRDEMVEAAKRIAALGPGAVVVKGGHLAGDPLDILYDGQAVVEFPGVRVRTPHTHGTGCTFSAAITAELAKGASLLDALGTAKAFISAAIREAPGLGEGHGPTNHWAYSRQHAGSDQPRDAAQVSEDAEGGREAR
ncbi:bifunctional hydroxymethylpyrimidine kinase/phosphomethylpyrimidine kinase [Kyrpidia sp.]|uniref:bifunctional hydroxymethylpyrimidine kinase/phosphomethylpyrimidine kinase n=1 Tax=Kyrpidia sp. TaxID=2073077 RepID=UPI0025896FAB|nr:bifunctional hydroxymethylpyrimidine kinase/phosphomethylpyrimidine kinase [Kyrpidia sp.]MCL6575806.1 bifunctional hydroxymethylpyrimidine kinase/phosphomethylpyrimidine kinase [Kyrpidia sp.]